MSTNVRKAVVAVAVSLGLLAPALGADTLQLNLRKGAQCKPVRGADAGDGSATHHCYFVPRAFGERDFSRRNGRAQFVFSELGPDCDEVELLGDEAYDHAGEALFRVAVRCYR